MVETHPQLRDQCPSIAHVSDIGLFLFTRIRTICQAPMWRRQWWVPWRVRSSRRVSYDPQSQTFQHIPPLYRESRRRTVAHRLLFSRIRQPSASSHLCMSLKLFFSSRTTARPSSSSLSSLLLYRYVLLMRMLSFSISLSQLLSFIPLSFRLYTPHPRSCLVLLAY
jgi:hypothetical protein